MSDDRRDDDGLGPLLDRYNTPPPMPLDSIWAGIEQRAATGLRDPGKRRRIVHLPWTWAAAAAVAVFFGGAAAGAGLMSGIAAREEVVELPVGTPGETDQGVRHVVWF